MTWLSWLWVAIGIASAYWLAQIFVYVFQSASRLKRAISISSSEILTLSNLPESAVLKVAPTLVSERAAIIAARRRRRRRRIREAEQRQRRLVSRIEKLMSEGGKSK